MSSFRSQQEARHRIAERREREDRAPRLATEVPRLTALRFEIENGDTRYAWPIVVERAPALFSIACSELTCQGGGHDLTWDIMAALRRSTPKMAGEDVCRGEVHTRTCGRILRYVAMANYRD